ncbi:MULTISPECIES: hypothetical protein [Streptomyces]|uniref:hypothetical protein n=1 Tax=Streptomyces TaxID=1883 RepID=UPI001EFB6219|nr:hypothetical protein [Streptomyces sp. CL12-4]MCG8968862.1 hypothetical protein [Streptomyces sp. CL12-4]
MGLRTATGECRFDVLRRTVRPVPDEPAQQRVQLVPQRGPDVAAGRTPTCAGAISTPPTKP